jgi:hypothetical protein
VVTSEELKQGISNALEVINIKGKYRLLPAIINSNIIKVLSIYLFANKSNLFHSDISVLFMYYTLKFSIYVRTSLGQVADHISVCRSGRICDTIARICQKESFVFITEQHILMVTAIRCYFISEG